MAVNMRGKRSSWPEVSRTDRMLRTLRSFEAEDAQWIPHVFREPNAMDLRNTDFVSLHEILKSSREYGRAGPRCVKLDQQDFTIANRRATFSAGPWNGPPVQVMAECGLSRMSNDCAKCYCCDVTFKGLGGNVCMWTRHRHFAPFCPHLKRAHAHGITSRNVEKNVRRQFSTGDSMSLH
ncbi:uncharacterized protein [Littorina saxatilis]|uniref:Uncharacterized protein n=1 Tax=Littorina saxatilis TaxID=31220 RepID=A0AAN9BQ91_9CAEN